MLRAQVFPTSELKFGPALEATRRYIYIRLTDLVDELCFGAEAH